MHITLMQFRDVCFAGGLGTHGARYPFKAGADFIPTAGLLERDVDVRINIQTALQVSDAVAALAAIGLA